MRSTRRTKHFKGFRAIESNLLFTMMSAILVKTRRTYYQTYDQKVDQSNRLVSFLDVLSNENHCLDHVSTCKYHCQSRSGILRLKQNGLVIKDRMIKDRMTKDRMIYARLLLGRLRENDLNFSDRRTVFLLNPSISEKNYMHVFHLYCHFTIQDLSSQSVCTEIVCITKLHLRGYLDSRLGCKSTGGEESFEGTTLA